MLQVNYERTMINYKGNPKFRVSIFEVTEEKIINVSYKLTSKICKEVGIKETKEAFTIESYNLQQTTQWIAEKLMYDEFRVI